MINEFIGFHEHKHSTNIAKKSGTRMQCIDIKEELDACFMKKARNFNRECLNMFQTCSIKPLHSPVRALAKFTFPAIINFSSYQLVYIHFTEIGQNWCWLHSTLRRQRKNCKVKRSSSSAALVAVSFSILHRQEG